MLNGMFLRMEIQLTMSIKIDHPDYPFGRVPGTLVIGVEPLQVSYAIGFYYSKKLMSR